MLGPWLPSAKRKRDEVEFVKPTYTDTRQSILDMSMCKLNTSPSKRVEPSLRRSVLIFNTLKHIEDELHAEGVKLHSNVEPSFSFTDVTADMLETAPLSLDSVAASIEQHMKSYPKNNASVVNTYDALEDLGQELRSQNLTKMEAEDTNLAHSCVALLEHCRQANQSLLFQSSPIKAEELFGSLDPSLTNIDLFNPVTCGSKLTQLTVDDIVHSISSNHSKSMQESPTFTQLVTAMPQCKIVPDDLLCEELDNIMQIIVGL